MKPQINFVVALQNEAKPLIEYYKLTLLHHYPFKVYKNENKWLIVSKVGNKMIKKACLHLSEISHSHLNTVWLNVGTAGHLHYPLGTILIANKIIDDHTKAIYYPSQIIKDNLKSTIVRTVEKNGGLDSFLIKSKKSNLGLKGLSLQAEIKKKLQPKELEK